MRAHQVIRNKLTRGIYEYFQQSFGNIRRDNFKNPSGNIKDRPVIDAEDYLPVIENRSFINSILRACCTKIETIGIEYDLARVVNREGLISNWAHIAATS